MSINRRKYLAHVNLEAEEPCHWLEDHLEGVSKMATRFGNEFGNGDWAGLAGLWHDLGKYSQAFQQMIKTRSGYNPDAHLEGNPGKVNHSTAGAIYALREMSIQGRILAYLIAGHHAGLTDWRNDKIGNSALCVRTKDEKLLEDALKEEIPSFILEASLPTSAPKAEFLALWIRMLFSCLVDADFLDTESFMSPEKEKIRGRYPDPAQLYEVFSRHMRKISSSVDPTPVNQIRKEIFQRCREKAEEPSGIFSLTVPTGGGKTLSSMEFALRYAIRHGKKRILYVIPYTSILEQTAEVFREAFQDYQEAVIEHHSNLDPKLETRKSRLACENWDAPVIVTTSVQFFESLFAVRTGRCRKLHNIVNSVVILDEVQTLPLEYLKPILQTIEDLKENYGVTFVLSTATQPALAQSNSSLFQGLREVREIVSDPVRLYRKLKRVRIEIPPDLNKPVSWDDLAEELRGYSSVLCIVSRRDDCRDLHSKMPAGTIHLSALMCGEHRSRVLYEIKDQLRNKRPIRVISTQLVEAGVDLDFPVVYRALAGLDSIAQAAGRCNREGESKQLGKVVVFVPPSLAPEGILRQSAGIAKEMLPHLEDPLSPDNFLKFFQELYWNQGEKLDKKNILEDLKPSRKLEIYFRTAADHFKLIDDYQSPLLVPYHNHDLLEQLRTKGPERWLMRKLQRYIVNIPERYFQTLEKEQEVEEIQGVSVLKNSNLYHEDIGLDLKKIGYYKPAGLVC